MAVNRLHQVNFNKSCPYADNYSWKVKNGWNYFWKNKPDIASPFPGSLKTWRGTLLATRAFTYRRLLTANGNGLTQSGSDEYNYNKEKS